MLRNLQRLSFNEVAERMERSRPAVQMLWMRAIKKLQEAMGTEEKPGLENEGETTKPTKHTKKGKILRIFRTYFSF